MSVVICAYTQDRWPHLQQAVASIESQDRPVREIIVVIDHNGDLLDEARRRWGAPRIGDQGDDAAPVLVVPSAGARGLSGARNTGVALATGQVVAFLDDDARADSSWSEQLLGPYEDPDVVACGGAAEPDLEGPRPAWWPLEFDWVVGCSYVGLPTGRALVRNLIGTNMSARRAAIVDVGGFAEGIGRLGSRPLGCEETDLFIRMAQRWPDGRIVFEPCARVHHRVPPARLSWAYFRSRCFAEGLSKAQVASRVGSGRALASEREYVHRVLPRGVAQGISGAWNGEEAGARRAGAIVAGLGATTAGYAWGRLAQGTRRRQSPPPPGQPPGGATAVRVPARRKLTMGAIVAPKWRRASATPSFSKSSGWRPCRAKESTELTVRAGRRGPTTRARRDASGTGAWWSLG